MSWIDLLPENEKSTLKRHVTSDDLVEKCDDSCSDCSVCLKINSNYQSCNRVCDRCKYCNFRAHNYKLDFDPPYWNRYPELPNPLLYGDKLYSEAGEIQTNKLGKLNYAHSKFTTTNVCGPVMYSEYIDRYNNFLECKRCKQRGMCWSQNRQHCVKCDNDQLQRSCESRFGCIGNTPNNIGGYVPPKNPLYTACIPCWKEK